MTDLKLKFDAALVCEYVANGENNKYTLVNVFSGDILVQSFPASINLGFYLEYVPDIAQEHHFDLMIKAAGRTFLNVQVNIFDHLVGQQNAVVLPSLGFTFEHAGDLEVLATSNKRKRVLIKKRVFEGLIGKPVSV